MTLISKYIIYGKEFCKYCTKAKEYLNEKNINYTYIDLDNEEDLHDELKEQYNIKTIPIIFFEQDEKIFVGGYVDLLKHYESTFSLN